ncbi:hypothetical protein [Streptomyces sp. NPDC048659]|uniref:hypothetical protein n=1 Tax=Streptomyces sp. NPDC048659 TaxID=3155489 RepID=UPI00341B7B44
MTQHGPDATATAPTPTAPESAPAAEEVSTPGGLPVIPAVTVGTTGTIATVSATGLAAGGGAALLLAGALALVPAVVAVARAPRLAGGRAGTPRRAGGVPTQRPGARPAPASALRSAGAGLRRSGSGGRSGSGSGAASPRAGRSGAGLGARAAQHAAAVRQARRQSAAQTAHVGRTAAGAQKTAARRQLADGRRDARQQRRAQQQNSGAGTGRSRLSLSKGTAAGGRHRAPNSGRQGAQSASGGRGGAVGRMWRAGRGAAAQTLARARRRNTTAPATTAPKVGGSSTPRSTSTPGREPRGFLARRRAAYRQARDQIRDRWRAQAQRRLEERARTRARRNALRRSAARFQARRALAALAATPLGVLAMALWPLAKLLRFQPPRWGRAVWRGLTRAATQARVERDIAAYQDHEQAEADRAEMERPRPGDVDRPRRAGAVEPTTSTTEADMTQGFDFRDAAADMLTQAQSAEPGGMMQVLAQIETLPEAMAAIAETFATVAAQCSPDNMPLHPAVNDALSDLHKQLVSCVDAAEAVGELFHTHHEADIARHTDGRTAEELWDVSRNEE